MAEFCAFRYLRPVQVITAVAALLVEHDGLVGRAGGARSSVALVLRSLGSLLAVVRFSGLPAGLRGSSARNSTCLGTLKFASRSRQ